MVRFLATAPGLVEEAVQRVEPATTRMNSALLIPWQRVIALAVLSWLRWTCRDLNVGACLRTFGLILKSRVVCAMTEFGLKPKQML